MSFKNCQRKKLINAFADEKQRSYMEQQLPPAARGGDVPQSWAPFTSLTLHTSAGRTRRRRQTDTSNTAQSLHSENNSYTSVPLSSLQKRGEDLQKHVALRTEFNKTSKQNPLEQNARTGMQTEFNQPFFFSLTSSTYKVFFFRVTVSKHKSVSCTKIKGEYNVTLSSTKHWFTSEDWGIPPHQSLNPDSIIQRVSQGN